MSDKKKRGRPANATKVEISESSESSEEKVNQPARKKANTTKTESVVTDSNKRCSWSKAGVIPSQIMMDYHDTEWGVPVHDDGKHFEFLILEGAQAGLSWRTILHRREGYRISFAQFDPVKVANFDEKKIAELMLDTNIIRNQAKVRAAVSNAQAFLRVKKEFGSFDNYIWKFVNSNTIQNQWNNIAEIPTETDESRALSADLKKRGFKFVGPTIMYSHMQAVGMVNDHVKSCFRYAQLSKLVKK